ncbi:MAG: CoA activase [Spirochaetes bacterium]|nr:CoA activase [Spirochaetota bacterium]
MNSKTGILGIDIGSIAISIAELDRERRVVRSDYAFHHGAIAEALATMLEGFELSRIGGVAATSSTPSIVAMGSRYDSRVAFITAAREFNDRLGSLLIVGGEKFGLVLFDAEGEYLNYRSNTSCAAGTGSFLDQQASRLSLPGIREFSELAFRNTGEIPKIASRCAVFAKTDLIHAQQEGYSLEEICDGLSFGLVRNIADTLFGNVSPLGPMVFCGGVSRNRAVVRHFSRLLGMEIVTDEYSHVYGAIGAALGFIDDKRTMDSTINSPGDLINIPERVKRYFHAPLSLEHSDYPDFAGLDRYEYMPRVEGFSVPVEVDVYDIPSGTCDAYLGVDIGSTSTKAMIIGTKGEAVAGFYTRTSGRPVAAAQALLDAIEDMGNRHGASFAFQGAGTTGSGRRFVGQIIGADLALDEITAHARAAVELDPLVDTIIEIGGQDSKFTTLRNGMVTFSFMNHVCAAGTGSFIEEQAGRLGCGLAECAARAEGRRAPLSSDRCTVFMERDINNYLTEGYDVDEVLASVLHSVRDNYLSKVATERHIGERIFFQGATAKNRALVAAFEQRLGRPIMVSKYCHLTGAMGVALTLHDRGETSSAFRGTDLWREPIPVRTEVCELCTNHCKITVSEVKGETVAFGFLCGRDYQTEKFVKQRAEYDLIRTRESIQHGDFSPVDGAAITVGIPAALHLLDEIPLWRRFFGLLGVKTITSEGCRDAVAAGKNLAGAEFCAPLTALYGHVRYLEEKADYVFLPHYMENRQPDRSVKRNYCYYTQYSPTIVLSAIGIQRKERILSPLVRSNLGNLYMKVQLHRMMKTILGEGARFMQVSAAYERALDEYGEGRRRLVEFFEKETARGQDVSVVFLGRPYTVLSRSMNKGIPEIFARHGVRTYFQDMVPPPGDGEGLAHLLGTMHWKYASGILEAAQSIAERRGIYPVFVTSFKCTPDAYAMEYFKRILDAAGKPYLILQLDEHDSSVGYETRIEAGIRSFRNHFSSPDQNGESLRVVDENGIGRSRELLEGKTLLLPNWDSISCRLVEAALRKEGIDARIVSESRDSIQRSMRFNSGQCIPLNIMIQNYIDYIEEHELDPERTVVWSLESKIACNIGMFPHYTKFLLESFGGGYDKIQVYRGDVTFVDVSVRTGVNCYLAYFFGGMLRRMGCYLRPHETVRGSVDAAVERSVALLYDAFIMDLPKEEALEEVIGLFRDIETARTERPKVAIFGDLYVRDNDVMNQGLIRTIEENGGEVITTPYSELMSIVADRYIRKWFMQGLYGDAALAKVLTKVVSRLNSRYGRYFKRILPPQEFDPVDDDALLERFGLSVYHTGESMENILKIFHLTERHSDLALFVQTNPSYCCPSLVTEAMADRIEALTGVPIVTIEYDGTGGSKNEDVIPYLKFPRGRTREGVIPKAM